MKLRSITFRFLLSCSLLVTICLPSLTLAADKLGVALPYLPGKIDPLNLDEPVTRLVLNNIAYALTKQGENNEVELQVAASLQANQDFTSCQITPRPDARFSSISLLTPEKLKESLEYLINQSQQQAKQIGSSSSSFLSHIKSVSVIEKQKGISPKDDQSPRLVQIDFQTPRSDLALQLSVQPLIDSAIAKSFNNRFGQGTNFSGLGPYQIRENKPNRGILLEKTGSFYLPDRPKCPIVDLQLFKDAKSALSALRVGAVDIIPLPTEQQIIDIAQDPTLTTIPSPFLTLKKDSPAWKLQKSHWSNENENSDLLTTDKIIIRKSLEVDQSAKTRFDLSGTFLP